MTSAACPRSALRGGVIGLSLLALAACDTRDAGVLPTALPSPTPRASFDARLDDGGSVVVPTSSDTTLTLFRIDPSRSATYAIGSLHRLVVRKRGVCALTAPYGPLYWDARCEIAKHPILVTARTWFDTGGHPRIEFSPELRFAPSPNSNPSAELYMKDVAATGYDDVTILYCENGVCVDEAAADPSLVTVHDASSGYVSRRIKHFSGYEVSVGRGDSAEQGW